MSSLVKVSVIVPVHNAEEFLEECLESILNQTYKNIEIICINDHSVDNSLEILEKYARKDVRVKVLSLIQNVHGVGAARNRGLEAVTGDFVAYCDSDDMMAESMIEQMINRMLKDKSDVVYCANKSIYEDGKIKIRQFKRFSPKQLRTVGAKSLYKNMFDLPLEPWNKLINYKKLKKVKFNPNIVSGQDVPYNVEILLNSEKVSFINKPLYIYRVRKKSLCHSENNVLVSFSEKHYFLIYLLKKYNLFDAYKNVYVRYLFNDVGYNIRRLSNKNKIYFVKIIDKFIINNKLLINRPNKIVLSYSWLIYHLFPIGKSYVRFKLKEKFKYNYNKKMFFDHLNRKTDF